MCTLNYLGDDHDDTLTIYNQEHLAAVAVDDEGGKDEADEVDGTNRGWRLLSYDPNSFALNKGQLFL
jgi:hypothetical protein